MPREVLKRCGSDIRNTSDYERSVMGRVLAEQMRQLHSGISNGLLGPLSDFSRVFPGSSASKAHLGSHTHTNTPLIRFCFLFAFFLGFSEHPVFCFEGGLSTPFS